MTPRPGLGVAAVGPITPDGGGLFLTRCNSAARIAPIMASYLQKP